MTKAHPASETEYRLRILHVSDLHERVYLDWMAAVDPDRKGKVSDHAATGLHWHRTGAIYKAARNGKLTWPVGQPSPRICSKAKLPNHHASAIDNNTPSDRLGMWGLQSKLFHVFLTARLESCPCYERPECLCVCVRNPR